MARPKLDLLLLPAQKQALQRLLKAPAAPQKLVRRARIVLLAAQGLDNARIAQTLQTSPTTVGLWRQRFIDLRLAGLAEAPRAGRLSSIDPARVHRAITEVVRPPPKRARWSTRTMARAVGLSKNRVQRIWRANEPTK